MGTIFNNRRQATRVVGGVTIVLLPVECFRTHRKRSRCHLFPWRSVIGALVSCPCDVLDFKLRSWDHDSTSVLEPGILLFAAAVTELSLRDVTVVDGDFLLLPQIRREFVLRLLFEFVRTSINFLS